MADRGEPLLHARRREFARPYLYPGGDVHRLHGSDRRHAGDGTPRQKFICGAGVGPARVRVADDINAKAEGIESKPAFRDAFQRRRRLVPHPKHGLCESARWPRSLGEPSRFRPTAR